MCLAIETMRAHKIVTLTELLEAEREINEYVGRCGTLRNILDAYDLPSEYEDRMAIYSNWKDKPYLVD